MHNKGVFMILIEFEVCFKVTACSKIKGHLLNSSCSSSSVMEDRHRCEVFFSERASMQRNMHCEVYADQGGNTMLADLLKSQSLRLSFLSLYCSLYGLAPPGHFLTSKQSNANFGRFLSCASRRETESGRKTQVEV